MTANSGLEIALLDAIHELNGASIPYMLIGGLALSAWALPRATLDVDITVWVNADEIERVTLFLASHYRSRTGSPVAFVRQMRVLPVETASGVRLDFLFAAFAFEKVMIDRAIVRRIREDEVRVATLEDLILLKLPSSRVKDRADMELILERYGRELDWVYLLSVADMLAETL